MTTSKLSDPNLETICRLCLKPNSGTINIFQSQLSIPVRVMACAALEVRTDDGLPSLVCEDCRYQLEVSYYFRKKCQISDGKLRKHIRLLNAGKKSRVFLKSTDDDDEPDEEELQCEDSIKFIKAADALKKAQQDEKNQKWLEEQREEIRREDTKRLFEEFGSFMQSRMPAAKTVKQENEPRASSSFISQTSQPSRFPKSNTVTPKSLPKTIQHEQQQNQQNHQQQDDEMLQPEADTDNEITSSEQITEEQVTQHQQEHQMFYSEDGYAGEEESSEMLIFQEKNNDEERDHQTNRDEEIVHIEGEDDTEIVHAMCEDDEEEVVEDENEENEQDIDEFIFLADFEDSNNDKVQSERACEAESYQIEENGDIQYLKDEKVEEEEIHSNRYDTSADTKYNIDIEDRSTKFGEKVPVKLENKKKQKKVELTVINKVVGVIDQKVSTEDLRIFKCSECPQSFTRAYSLIRHRSAHKGGKEYCCDYCEKFFSCKSSLDRHIRIHTGEKPYSCDQCGKNFMQKEILKRHMTIHTGNRPYQCPHCPRSFVQKLLMKQHINAVHLAVPQVASNDCHLCSKSFLHASGLSRHLLTHKGKLFGCPICGRTFNDKSSLRRHFSAVHMKKDQNTPPKPELDGNESSNEFLVV